MPHKLNKPQLRQLFDRITKQLKGKRAEVEVASLRLGDQIQADTVPLLGLSYDPDDDAVAIALEGIDITISKPRELSFDAVDGQWAALDIFVESLNSLLKCNRPCAAKNFKKIITVS